MGCTFKTVFYVNGSKERNGIVPIMGRVTINGTIALQAERDHGYLGFQGQQSHRQEQGSQGGEFIDSHCSATLRRDKYF